MMAPGEESRDAGSDSVLIGKQTDAFACLVDEVLKNPRREHHPGNVVRMMGIGVLEEEAD